jgi:hypothetical protein
VDYRSSAAAVLVCAALAACRSGTHGPAVPPQLARLVPPSAEILVGVDLAALRGSALYAKLPRGAQQFLEPFTEASYLLAASRGFNVLIAACGGGAKAPAGGTMLAPGLSVSGSPDAVESANNAFRAAKGEPPELVAWAEAAASYPVWLVARGTANLPVTGNLANLNRFLRSTAYTTAGIAIGPRLEFAAAAVCRTPAQAQRLEETLRAFVSLAAAASSGTPPGGVLQSLEYRTEGATLRIHASAIPADFEALWR